VFSGCAVTIINLPVSVTYGLAAASVPQIAPLAEQANFRQAYRRVWKALAFTLLVALPMAVFLFVLAPVVTEMLFGSLKAEYKELLILLIKIMAVNAVTSSLTQTSSACLTALGKPLCGTISQWVSAVLRVGITAFGIGVLHLGTIAAAVAANTCFLVAFGLNFWYIIREQCRAKRRVKGNADNTDWIRDGRRRLNDKGKESA
jgi:stage V sporulation protein B